MLLPFGRLPRWILWLTSAGYAKHLAPPIPLHSLSRAPSIKRLHRSIGCPPPVAQLFANWDFFTDAVHRTAAEAVASIAAAVKGSNMHYMRPYIPQMAHFLHNGVSAGVLGAGGWGTWRRSQSALAGWPTRWRALLPFRLRRFAA